MLSGDWLTLGEVEAAMLAAGYHDSRQSIRRMIDAGQFGDEGRDWYRTETGKARRVRRAAVTALIARRQSPSSEPDPSTTPPT
jgi:hypothetical protein